MPPKPVELIEDILPAGPCVGCVEGGMEGGQPEGVLQGLVEQVQRIVATPPTPQPKPEAVGKPAAAPAPPAPVTVSKGVQLAKLIRQVIPTYPPLAKSARISGLVQLVGVISKDGTIKELRIISGHPLLAPAALEAVRQWVYRPTLLNGEPVEVIAPIDVHFKLGQ
jgi:protein TonB